MRWEELTGDQFPQAVEQSKGVCLLPFSCIERHGHHLPTGTDMFIGRELCNRAAALEPAVVFPDFIFTQILEARHVQGTIAIDPELITRLLDNVCREIARNGLRKIVIVNAHGGNEYLINYFAQVQLASRKDYVVYVPQPLYNYEDPAVTAQWETTVDGHAGERETSMIMAVRPELVHKEALPRDGEGMPLERLKELRDASVNMGIWWYADHPTHYCGDGASATAEKGLRWFEDRANILAKIIRLIKDDTETQRLQDEFFSKAAQH